MTPVEQKRRDSPKPLGSSWDLPGWVPDTGTNRSRQPQSSMGTSAPADGCEDGWRCGLFLLRLVRTAAATLSISFLAVLVSDSAVQCTSPRPRRHPPPLPVPLPPCVVLRSSTPSLVPQPHAGQAPCATALHAPPPAPPRSLPFSAGWYHNATVTMATAGAAGFSLDLARTLTQHWIYATFI